MQITKYLKVWSIFNREAEETDFVVPKNLPKSLPTGESGLKSLPTKIRESAGKIASAVTFDRIAQAGIATCVIVGGVIATQSTSPSHANTELFDGALIATVGSGAILTAWGMISAQRKEKLKAIKCLITASVLFAAGCKIFQVANEVKLLQEKVSDNAVERKELFDEKVRLLKENNEYLDKNRDLSISVDELFNEKVKLLNEKADCQRKIDSLNSEDKKLSQENQVQDKCNDRIKSLNDEKIKFSNENKRLLNDNGELNRKAKILNTEKERLYERNQKLVNENKNLSNENKELNRKNNDLLNNNNEISKSKQELTSKISDFSIRLGKCERKVKALENGTGFETQPDGNQKREITFGTTYISDGSRDEISKMINENHKEYAERWDLRHKVVDYSLLKEECKDIDAYYYKNVDCVPYWNKIALLRNWLKEPANPEKKEEWYILADDDMPVTNMKVNPYEAIDLLRRGLDTSVIIAEDVVPWKDNDPKISVNTGLLFVRKDEQSRQLIEKIWERRNDKATDKAVCRTLGTCKNQDTLHEQDALGRILKNERSLIDRVITVVKPRDTYNNKEIAINTFKRDGCFYRQQENWSQEQIIYSWDNKFPEGKWKMGDWMGQTAGVPRTGWHCGDKSAGKPAGPLRADYLKIMLGQVVRESV